MTHSTRTIEANRTPRRVAGALAMLLTAGLLGACALQPGPAYNLSQFQRGDSGFNTAHAGTGEPTYYPR